MSDSKRVAELEARVETLEEKVSELRSHIEWLEKEMKNDEW